MIISFTEPLVPIFVFVLHQLKATVILERISLAQLVLKAIPSRSSLLKYCLSLRKFACVQTSPISFVARVQQRK